MTLRIILALIVILMAVGFIAAAPAHPADAATSTTTFPVSYEARPGTVQPGDVILIASYPVGASNPIIGLTCGFRVTSSNDESVHINSYAEIRTNGSSTLVLGTEDGVNGVHVVDSTLVMGETVEVWYHVGERALGEKPIGISVELEVSYTCTTTDVTTTTTSTPTTTPSSSTTSTIPPTTTTSTPDGSTSTSQPATSTTAPTDSTTTTHHDPVTPPTEPPGSSTVPPVSTPDPTLPLTGPTTDAGLWFAIGAALTLTGGVLVSRLAVRGEGR